MELPHLLELHSQKALCMERIAPAHPKRNNFVIGQQGYSCRSGLGISLESVLLLQKHVDLIVFPQPAQSNKKDYQWER